MSGIFGLFQRDGRSVDRYVLQPALDAQAHRGPDDAGEWSGEHVFFAHQMLHTTPESLEETQPVTRADDQFVLIADARIDNRADLIRALRMERRSGTVITDSEIILAAYQKWGADCPDYLVGDFAFAIWDERRQRLFCARDPMGVKPFYYVCDQQRLAFASEINSIRALPDVPEQIGEEMVAHFLAGSFSEEKEITFYENIFRLPAAHAMVVTSEEVRMWQHWQVDTDREAHFDSDEEYVEAFREKFTEAVRCRLRSAFPVGTFLSGGLDSSSVACTARDLLGGEETLHTFSAIFPDLSEEDLKLIDERKYIEAVVAQGGFEPHYVRADRLSPLTDVDELIARWGQPYFATNFYLHWSIYQRAQENGVRVLLDGLDGDSVVLHGRSYLEALAEAGRWGEFERQAKALGQRENIPQLWRYAEYYGFPYLAELARKGRWGQFLRQAREVQTRFDLPARRLYVDQGVKHAFSGRLHQLWKSMRGSSNAEAEPTPSLLERDFARRMGMESGRSKNGANLPRKAPGKTEHWESLTNGIWQSVFEMDDPPASACAIEQRSPFFDRRLVEYCIALPLSQKLSDGWTRMVLRRAMEGILPPEVQWRTSKSDVSPGFKSGLVRKEHALQRAAESQELGPYVNREVLKEARERFLDRPRKAGEEPMQLLAAVMLHRWLCHKEVATAC